MGPIYWFHLGELKKHVAARALNCTGKERAWSGPSPLVMGCHGGGTIKGTVQSGGPNATGCNMNLPDSQALKHCPETGSPKRLCFCVEDSQRTQPPSPNNSEPCKSPLNSGATLGDCRGSRQVRTSHNENVSQPS